jgi:hypothetical protein
VASGIITTQWICIDFALSEISAQYKPGQYSPSYLKITNNRPIICNENVTRFSYNNSMDVDKIWYGNIH